MQALRGPPWLSGGGTPAVAPLATVRAERLHGWVAARGRRWSSAAPAPRLFDPPTSHVAAVPGVRGLLRCPASLRGGPTAELAPPGSRRGLCRRGAGKGCGAPCRGRRARGAVRPPPSRPPISQAMCGCGTPCHSVRPGPRRSSRPRRRAAWEQLGRQLGHGLPSFDARGRPAASQISSPSPRILFPAFFFLSTRIRNLASPSPSSLLLLLRGVNNGVRIWYLMLFGRSSHC
jgi:hypothetical protein